MKKRIAILSLFISFQFFLPVLAKEAVTFKVGIYQNEPKIYLDEDGKPAGLWVELLEYIAQKEGWRLTFVSGSWQQCLERLERGEIDILPDVGYSENRANIYRFNQETVLSNWARIYSHDSHNIERIEDLKDKKVAVMKGDISFKEFKLFNIPCSYVLCEDYQEVFLSINGKKADAGVISRLYGQLYENRYPVKRTSIILAPAELRFAFPEKIDPNLIAAIDFHLAALKNDQYSFYHNTLDKWFGERVRSYIPREIKAGLIVAAILTCLFAILSFLLGKKIRSKNRELKKRYQELEKSEQRYRLHFENSSDVIYSTDSQLRITDISPSVERILGYRPEEVLGKSFPDLNLLAPEDVDRAVSDTMRVLTGEDIGHQVYVFMAKNGKRVFGEVASRFVGLTPDNGRLISVARDVTERKHAEEKLRENEHFIRTVLDNLPIGIATNSVDPVVEFDYMNDSFPKFYRTTKESLRKKDAFWNVIYEDPEFREEMKKRVLDDCASGDPARMYWPDIPIKREGRGTKYISAQNIPVSGTPLMISTVWDITHRKILELELVREKDLHYTLSYLLLKALTLESENEIADIYLAAAERLTGSEFGFIGEINENDRLDTIAQSDIDINTSCMPNHDKIATLIDVEPTGLWGRVLKEERCQIVNDPVSDPDYREPPEGHPPITSFLGVPLLREGKAIGMIALANKPEEYEPFDRKAVEQISSAFMHALDRIRAQKALKNYSQNLEKMVEERTRELYEAKEQAQRSRDRLNAVLVSVADGLVVTNHDFKVALMNPAAEALLGLRFSEVQGQPLFLSIEDNTLRERMRTALNEKEPGYQFDFEVLNDKPESSRILRAKTSKVETRREDCDYRDHMVIVISDVTFEREIDRLKTDFMSTAAHELRTPLTTILGFSEILVTKKNLEPEKRKEYLSYIHTQAVSLSQIIDDLLDISRIESGKGFLLHKESFDMGRLLEGTVEKYRARFPDYDFEIQVSEKPLEIYADRKKLNQVLDNIINNAIKYSPTNTKIRIGAQMSEKAKNMLAKSPARRQSNIIVCIEDEGIGIAEDQLNHVFEKFWRANYSDTGIEGTGLGMSIVKHIVEAHDGNVKLDSDLNQGTKVVIEIPCN